MTEPQPTGTIQPADAAESTPFTTGVTPTSAPPAPPDDAPLPREFGRYELRRLLGRGGMGRVYLAHDPHLDRLVALKMPSAVAIAGWRERFLAEARAAATLTHPNVCPVYDVGEVEGQPYLTMGFIEGETLAAKLARDGTLAPAEAVGLVRTVARAMHEAHRRGIVHRDLKPANLMLDAASRPVVMDFGLAIRSTSADDLRLTLTGVALGTPAYMPPEQASGEHDDIGPASDVYSLGVILYELVTGRTPFKGKSFGKLLAQIERDVPPSPSSLNQEVDAALEAIMLTCLAKAPADRFADAGALADALERYQEGDRSGITAAFGKPYRVPDATSEYRPSPSRFSNAIHPKPRRRAWWLAGAAALLSAAIAGTVIYVQTDYGQLEVRLSDPTAKVDVKVNGQEVTLAPEGGKPIRIRAGANQKLEVTGPDYETVSESFDLKRNGVTIVQVTLKPRGDAAKGPDPTQKPGTVTPPTNAEPPKKPDPPKPVPYPEKSTLIELPGWQVLTDATNEQMQTWLDDRKKAGHSVMWLDVTPVAGKPLYSAVAALDGRESKWIALLDIPAEGMNKADPQPNVIDSRACRVISVSGFPRDGSVRTALLTHPGWKRWCSAGDLPEVVLKREIDGAAKSFLSVRVIRGIPVSDHSTLFAVFGQSGSLSATLLSGSASELEKFLTTQRGMGNIPNMIAAAPRDNALLFSAVGIPNTDKWEWHTDTALTAAELKSKATTQAGKGYRPSCVTAYPWDGAVRYCVVWVKEPPKPVKYPDQPTLIEADGWQVLTDATKEQMQKWLDERKAAKHSVMWLDAYQIEGKPVFCAVAALDDRQPDWTAVLGLQAKELGDVRNAIDTRNNYIVSLSGYSNPQGVVLASLWRKGKKLWYISPINTPDNIKTQIEQSVTRGASPRILRNYPIGGEGSAYALYGETVPEKTTLTLDQTAAELDAFLQNGRKDGFRPLSLSGSLKIDQPVFIAVMEPNKEKWEWQAETNLTADQLKSRAATLSSKGFHPSCVTAYPWDGAVRYCVVWVKEPPKPVPFP